MIRQAVDADAAAICAIYNHYIAESIITFEEQAVVPAEMSRRLAEVAAVPLPWLVAEKQGVVVGYASASKWKVRSAYRFATETTIYLSPGATGQGIGADLYRALLQQLKESNLHVAIGGIALPNEASIALHEKLGFRKVAHFAEVGFKFGKWIDVAYWQLAL